MCCLLNVRHYSILAPFPQSSADGMERWQYAASSKWQPTEKFVYSTAPWAIRSRDLFSVSPFPHDTFMRKSFVWRAILMDELPTVLNSQGLQVVVGIAACVARRPVPHFEVDHILCGLIDQSMAITRTRFEPRTHPR